MQSLIIKFIHKPSRSVVLLIINLILMCINYSMTNLFLEKYITITWKKDNSVVISTS